MAKFQFSLSRLQKFQIQKQKLAELAIIRCQSARDQRRQQLHDLYAQLDQATTACQNEMTGNAKLIHSHKDWIENLNREIESAKQDVQRLETELAQAIANTTDEKQKTEMYETLCKSEKEVHDAQVERTEQIEIADFLLRKLPVSEGNSTDA